MTDIERVPSLRKEATQGVPTKDLQHARPAAQPDRSAEPDLAADAQAVPGAGDVMPVIRPETHIDERTEPQMARPGAPEPAGPPEPAGGAEPTAAAEPKAQPITVRELLRRVDVAWSAFRGAAFRFPSERMDEHLAEDGWTRKQMLAHLAAWHDLTSDRLVKLINTGRPAPLERDVDAINAGVARIAVGKTAGEVLKDVEATFNRLRRQLQRLTDAQLRGDDAWAAQIIAENTFEHYAEHMVDLFLPEPEGPPTGRR